MRFRLQAQAFGTHGSQGDSDILVVVVEYLLLHFYLQHATNGVQGIDWWEFGSLYNFSAARWAREFVGHGPAFFHAFPSPWLSLDDLSSTLFAKDVTTCEFIHHISTFWNNICQNCQFWRTQSEKSWTTSKSCTLQTLSAIQDLRGEMNSVDGIPYYSKLTAAKRIITFSKATSSSHRLCRYSRAVCKRSDSVLIRLAC